MAATIWTEADTARARRFWDEYQRGHDVSDRTGQAVGIDPDGRRVWFGASSIEIKQQLEAEGVTTPVFCVLVGADSYLRKGGRSWYMVL